MDEGNEPTERGNQLTHRPPDGEQSEQVAGRLWQKFQKQRSIDRKIATDAHTHTGKKGAQRNPTRRCASCEPKNTSNKESQVESESTPNQIRRNAPETRSNA